MSDRPNYYKILEILHSATQDDILHAYRRARQTFSKNSIATYSLYDEKEIENIITMVEEAYSVLSNREYRRKYDKEMGYIKDDTEVLERDRENGFSYSSVIDEDGADEDLGPVGAVGDGVTDLGGYATKPLKNEDDRVADKTQEVADVPEPVRRRVQENRPPERTVKRPMPSSVEAYVPDQEFERMVSDEKEYGGAFLKKIREHRKISLEEIADRTRIKKVYLAAMESEDFSLLPQKVFLRGFLASYARELGVDSDKVVQAFLKKMEAVPGTGEKSNLQS